MFFVATILPGEIPIVDTIQYFMCKFGMKSHMHLVEIISILLYHVIIRPSKTFKRADKNWAYFLKIKYFKNLSFQTKFIDKFWSPILHYNLQRKKIRKIPLISKK